MTAIIQPSIQDVIDNLFETGAHEAMLDTQVFRDWAKVRGYHLLHERWDAWMNRHDIADVLEEYLTDMRRAVLVDGYTARCAAKAFCGPRGLQAIGPDCGKREFRAGGKRYLVTVGEQPKAWLVFPV